MPLRNAAKLGYPFELALKSLRLLVDELVVLVDPASEDDTLARVKALSPDVLVESVWDMTNHRGHTNCEITIQTQKALDACTGDWVFSLQADEILHEDKIRLLRVRGEYADRDASISAVSLPRLYFYQSLKTIRQDWTQYLVRFFKRGLWKPDIDGAMKFEPVTFGNDQVEGSEECPIFHYSRVGNPQIIANRVRNLDHFFHAPERIADEAEPYNFSEMRKLDTYVKGTRIEVDPDASLVNFPLEGHPKGVREWFGQ